MTLSITINKNASLSIMQSIVMLSVNYARCHLCSVSFMLSVTCKPFMLSVVMLYVVTLCKLEKRSSLSFTKHPFTRIKSFIVWTAVLLWITKIMASSISTLFSSQSPSWCQNHETFFQFNLQPWQHDPRQNLRQCADSGINFAKKVLWNWSLVSIS
jgi:hypothetical protein